MGPFEDFTAEDGPAGPGSRLLDDELEFRASRETSFALLETTSQLTLRSDLCSMSVEGTGLFNPLSAEWNKGDAGVPFFPLSRMRATETFGFQDVWEKKSECAVQEQNTLRQQQWQAQQGVQQPEQHVGRQRNETQHTEQERQSQGEELRGHDVESQPKNAAQEQQQMVQKLSVAWEPQPTTVSCDRYPDGEPANEKSVAKEAGSDWCPTASFSPAQSEDQGSSGTWVAGSVASDEESERTVHICAAGPPRSMQMRAGAVADKYGPEGFAEASGGGGSIKEKSCGGLVERQAQQSNQVTAFFPPANRLRKDTTTGAGEGIAEPRRFSVFSAASGTATQDTEKWIATRGSLTDRSLSISALVAAASEQAVTSAAGPTGTPLSVSHVERCCDGNQDYILPGEKVEFQKQALTASRSCGNRGRVDTNGGVPSPASIMDDKDRLLSQILPCSSFTSPASTCSSTSSPRCEAACMSVTHAGRVITLPGIDIVSNVSTAAPTRAGSGNFTSNKLLATAERSGLFFSPSAVASLPEQFRAGQSATLGILPPPSVDARGIRKLLSNTPVISEAHESIFARQKTFPLSLPAATSVNSVCFGQGAKASSTDAAEGISVPAETSPLRDGTSGGSSASEGAASLETFEGSTVRQPLRSGSLQDDSLPEKHAIDHLDNIVAANNTSRTRPPGGAVSVACPLPPSIPGEESGVWRGANAVQLRGSSVSLRTRCENTLDSFVPPPVISATRLPMTDNTNSRSREPAVAKSKVQAAGFKDAVHDNFQKGNYLQLPKSHRHASRHDDEILLGLEHTGPALPAPPLTPASGPADQPRTHAGEYRKCKRDAFSKAARELYSSEQPLEDPTRTDTASLASETLLRRVDSFSPIHNGTEGACLERIVASVPSRCVSHLRGITPASAPLDAVGSVELCAAPHNEGSNMFDAVTFYKQTAPASCSRELENPALLHTSKRISTCSESALLSVSSAPTVLPSSASQPRETFTKKTAGEIQTCIPSTSSSLYAAELCEVQRGFSTAVERSLNKSEGCSTGLHGTPSPDPGSQEQNPEATILGVTPALLGACSPRLVPPLPRTTTVQHTPDVSVCAGSSHEGESNKRSLLPWKCFGGQPRPPHQSEASTAFVDSMRTNRHNSGMGNCHGSSTTYSHRGYAWYTSAAKRDSSSAISSTCRTKGTAPSQFRCVMPRDPCALQPHPSATRSGPKAPTGVGGSRKPQWSEAEDAMLQKFFEVFHLKWAAISAHLTARFGIPRTGKQCRERWCNHVNPAVKKGGWTPFEDAYILQRQKEMGNRWAAIAKELPGRTENAVKNRFISLSNCRGSGRSGGYSRATRDLRVDQQERQNGGTTPASGRVVLVNGKARTPELSQLHAHGSGSHSGAGGNSPPINNGSKEHIVQFRLSDTIAARDGRARGELVDDSLHKKRQGAEACAVGGTGASESDLPVAVREKEKKGSLRVETVDKDRRCLESVDGGESGTTSPHHPPQFQCAQQDRSAGVPVPGVGREIAASQETSRCEATAGGDLATCTTLGCDESPLKADVASECRPNNTAGSRAAQRMARRQEHQIRIRTIATQAPATGKDTHMRKRQRQVTEAADTCSLPSKTCSSSHAKQEVTRQETAARTTVRTPADLQYPPVVTKRRALINLSTTQAPPMWQERAETLVSTENKTPPKSFLRQPVVSQGACSSCAGLCRCTAGNSAAVPNGDSPSHPANTPCQGGKLAYTAGRTTSKLVEEQTPPLLPQRQQYLVLQQRWPGREEEQWTTTCNSSSPRSPSQKNNTWISEGLGMETLEASDMSSALWGVLLAKPTTARPHAARHSETQNTHRLERQQSTPREAVNGLDSNEHSPVHKDVLRKSCTQEHAETKATQLLQPSQAFPILTFPQLQQATRSQLEETNELEQEMPGQRRGLQQLCLLRRQSQETESGPRGSASCESTSSQIASQVEGRLLLPTTSAQRNSEGRRESKVQNTTVHTAAHTKQQEQHQQEREAEKQHEQQQFMSAADPREQFPGNAKGHHLLQLQEWGDAQTDDHDGCEREGCPQQLGEFQERRPNLRKHKKENDSVQEEQLVICLEGESESNTRNGTDAVRAPGAKQNLTQDLDHKPGCIQQADIFARCSLSNTLHCALPVHAEDRSAGQQSPRLQGEEQQQASVFSCFPLEKITMREALELSFAANTSLNDLRKSTIRGWSTPTRQPADHENLIRYGVRKLLPDTERKPDPVTVSHLSEEANFKRSKTVCLLSGIESPQRHQLEGPNQATASPTGSSKLMETVCSFSQGDCGATAVFDFAEGGRPKDASATPPSNEDENCLVTFSQTLPQLRPPQPQQQREHQQQLQQLLLAQRQPQQTPRATQQVPTSLETSLFSLRNSAWSGHDRRLGENVAGITCTAGEEHLAYPPGCNLPGTTELSGIKMCEGSSALASKEEQGFNVNISVATGSPSVSNPASGHRPVVVGAMGGERVASTTRNTVEERAAEVQHNRATEKAAAHSMAADAAGDSSLTKTISTEAGKLHGALSSFPEKARVTQQQEQNQHRVPPVSVGEQGASWKAAHAHTFGPPPDARRISSGMPHVLERMSQVSTQLPPSQPPRFPGEEEDDGSLSTAAPRQGTGACRGSPEGVIGDKIEISAQQHCGASAPALLPLQDFRSGCLTSAAHEELKQRPSCKSSSENLQSSARGGLPLTSLQREDTLQPQRAQEHDPFPRRTSLTGGSLLLSHNEQEPEKLCMATRSAQAEASELPTNAAASSSSALVRDEAESQTLAEHRGARSVCVNEKPGLDAVEQRDRQHLQEQQPLQGQREWRRPYQEAQEWLLGGRFLMAGIAATHEESKTVSVNQQLALQKQLLAGSEKASAREKEFVFEDLTTEAPRHPPSENASALSATAKKQNELTTAATVRIPLHINSRAAILSARRVFLEFPASEASHLMQACCFQLQSSNDTGANPLSSEVLLAATRHRETCIALTLLQHELQLDFQTTPATTATTLPVETTKTQQPSRALT